MMSNPSVNLWDCHKDRFGLRFVLNKAKYQLGYPSKMLRNLVTWVFLYYDGVTWKIVDKIFKDDRPEGVSDLCLFDDPPPFERSKESSGDDLCDCNVLNVILELSFIGSMRKVIGIFECFNFAWFGHNYKQSVTIYNYDSFYFISNSFLVYYIFWLS